MKETVLFAGGIFGALAVIFGAFGAHALKKYLRPKQLLSFETGVKYQMYHALMLICCGILFSFEEGLQILMGWCFILGVVFFSFSIYGLLWSGTKGRKWTFLGPVTPVGGLFLITGWILFICSFI